MIKQSSSQNGNRPTQPTNGTISRRVSREVGIDGGDFQGSFAVSRDMDVEHHQEYQHTHQHEKLVPVPAAEFPGSFAGTVGVEHQRKVSLSNDGRGELIFYFTDGWDDIEIWKSAFIELIGTMALCYLSALLYITIGSFKIVQTAPYVGVTNIVMLSLFILAVSPSSGGHMNPMITFATMATGLTRFCRGTLYMIGQLIGAAIAGGLVRGSFGEDLTIQYNGGGCFYSPGSLSEGQAFLIEACLSFILIFLSFGVGLDPRQRVLFGPKMGPFLVGCVLAITSFASVGLAGPQYQGAGLNPARCFACAVARGSFKYQWIWWVGPLCGTLLQAVVYAVAPPYHRERSLERAGTRQ